jgi:hypothetical protein
VLVIAPAAIALPSCGRGCGEAGEEYSGGNGNLLDSDLIHIRYHDSVTIQKTWDISTIGGYIDDRPTLDGHGRIWMEANESNIAELNIHTSEFKIHELPFENYIQCIVDTGDTDTKLITYWDPETKESEVRSHNVMTGEGKAVDLDNWTRCARYHLHDRSYWYINSNEQLFRRRDGDDELIQENVFSFVPSNNKGEILLTLQLEDPDTGKFDFSIATYSIDEKKHLLRFE